MSGMPTLRLRSALRPAGRTQLEPYEISVSVRVPDKIDGIENDDIYM